MFCISVSTRSNYPLVLTTDDASLINGDGMIAYDRQRREPSIRRGVEDSELTFPAHVPLRVTEQVDRTTAVVKRRLLFVSYIVVATTALERASSVDFILLYFERATARQRTAIPQLVNFLGVLVSIFLSNYQLSSRSR